MRIALCGSVAVFTALFAVPALAQAPAAAPPGSAPPAPVQPAYGPPPPGYYPPPPGYAQPPVNQERTAMNGLYVEGLGPGFFYSFNYDRVISDIALRIGIGYLSLSASNGVGDSAKAYWLSIPFDVNYIGIGSKKHIFELGAGATIVSVGAGASSLGVESQSGSVTRVYPHLNVGYRLQPPQGGFMLRTGISPIIGEGVFLPWPYIALGATF
jgi:hypothetical protein